MATMKVSKEGLMELIGHEAIVLTRYKDSVGVWTLGIGHTKAAGPPNPATFDGEMTVKQAVELFAKDIAAYARDVNSALKVTVSQTEFDALVSFHFNTGAIKRASLTKSLNGGDRKKAAEQFMNWKKPPEIMKRRKKEQKLFAKGEYSEDGMALLIPADKNGKVLFSKSKRVRLADHL